jgi:hypothetical protein
MSDEEAFLTRWSRRKREAETPAEPLPVQAEATQSADRAIEAPEEGAARRPEQPVPPQVDLSALPPIESITAETDIRAFLASGVPAQLARAALRRAWSADPAIRDFVGLAENAWDFTAPEGVPGFGPLLPADAAATQVADLFSHDDQASLLHPATPDESEQKSEPEKEREARAPARDVEESQLYASVDPADSQCDEVSAAVQKKTAVEIQPTRVARSHGGALPQ